MISTLLVALTSLPIFAETLTLTTYYPSPFGAYDTIRLVPQASRTGVACNIGELYIQTGTNKLVVCSTGTWTDTPAWFWELIGTNLYPSNPLSNVAIGINDTGGAKLRVYTGTSNLDLVVNPWTLSLRDSAAVNFLPYIQWVDEAGLRAMYMGWGSTVLGSRFLEMTTENAYNLALMGNNVGIGKTTPIGKLEVSDTLGRSLLLTRTDHAFLNAPFNAHLTGNGYWNAANWFSFDTTRGSSLVDAVSSAGAGSAAGQIHFYTAPASAGAIPWSAKMIITNNGTVHIYAGDGTWGGWLNAINFASAAHAAITLPSGGLLFGLHSNHWFYWANTTIANLWGGYIMQLDSINGDLYVYRNISAATGSMWAATTVTASDGRLKKDLHPITNALEKLDSIRPVTFKWNEESKKIGRSPGKEDIGVVAQDVQKIFPELVTANREGVLGVDYGRLSAVLLAAIKELQTEVDGLKEKIKILETK